MILASADTMTIEKLAEMADRIMDVATPTVSPVGAAAAAGGGDLRRIVREEVTAVLQRQERSPRPSFRRNRGGRNRSRRRSSSRSQSPINEQANQEGVCWYHRQFGSDARKCRPPCSAGNSGASR